MRLKDKLLHYMWGERKAMGKNAVMNYIAAHESPIP